MGGILFVVVGILLTFFGFNNSGNNKLIILAIGLVFVICGIVVTLLTKFSTVTIDKANKKLTILRSGILGKKTSNYPLVNLQELEMREGMSINSFKTNKILQISQELRYQLFLIFTDGQMIPLDHIKSSNTSMLTMLIGTGRNKEAQLGNTIASFIGVPFQDIEPAGPTINPLGNIPPIRL